MDGGSYRSWRDEVLACLAQFPAGVTASELTDYFDRLRTADFFRRCLASLAREGVAVRLASPVSDGVVSVPMRGPHARVRYRLADAKLIKASSERAT